jgi:hypothetical protein
MLWILACPLLSLWAWAYLEHVEDSEYCLGFSSYMIHWFFFFSRAHRKVNSDHKSVKEVAGFVHSEGEKA